MKSQTTQIWLHATAVVLASFALANGLWILWQDSAMTEPPNLPNEPPARFSETARFFETGFEKVQAESRAKRSLVEFRPRPQSIASELSIEANLENSVGTPQDPKSSVVSNHAPTSIVEPAVSELPFKLPEIVMSKNPEGPQWLKGDGFILGWNGSSCITAVDLESSTDLTTILQSINPGAIRNSAQIALASYSEKPRSEESYEDSDLWESDQDSSSNSSDGSGSGKQPDAIGVPPPRPQPQFLRDTSVLLDPGEYQFEYGVSYTTNLQTTAIGVNVNDNTVVTSLRTLTRTASVPLEFRVGCRNDVQAFMSLPFGYNLQQISIANTADSNDGIGIGDLSFGLTRVLRKPQPERFTILGNMSTSAPTGLAQLSNIQQVPGVALGSGYWTLSGGLVFIRSVDPIAAFVGLNYTQTFQTTLNNLDLEPGNIFSYRFGLGYAINSRVTISSSFNGAYISELEVAGRTIPGSAREPLTVRLAATILSKGPSLIGPAKGRRKTTEPFIAMGVTDAAPDTSFGVRWTY